jgi:hypothetical protein
MRSRSPLRPAPFPDAIHDKLNSELDAAFQIIEQDQPGSGSVSARSSSMGSMAGVRVRVRARHRAPALSWRVLTAAATTMALQGSDESSMVSWTSSRSPGGGRHRVRTL